jgi:hypothetical protein
MKNISKSRYTSFLTCQKQFWLNCHKPDLAKKDASLQARFDQGHEIGEMALKLFPNIVDTTTQKEDGALDIGAMIEKTQHLIAQNCPAIAEAAFSGDGIYCAVDTLKNNGDKTWDIYEVKSSTGVKPIYYLDIAFQKYALTACGVKVRNCYAVYINNRYVRNGNVEPSELFSMEEVSLHLPELTQDIPENLKKAQEIYANKDEPQIDISENCDAPTADLTPWQW